MSYDEAIAYVKDVLDTWIAWQGHHQGLTEALKIIIQHIETEETTSEPKKHTTRDTSS